jgi:tryptophan-rich sensory protein
MLPPWLIIGGIAFILAVLSNRLSTQADFQWFIRLRRPTWLTFERLIPLIWIFILSCGVGSATLVWQANPGSPVTWVMMAGYLVLESTILAYTPVMCKLRNLTVGTFIGGTGFVFGCCLALWVSAVSAGAVMLLLPYLAWSPIGTFVTWKMVRLNPSQA